jgi:hypothetical protein
MGLSFSLHPGELEQSKKSLSFDVFVYDLCYGLDILALNRVYLNKSCNQLRFSNSKLEPGIKSQSSLNDLHLYTNITRLKVDQENDHEFPCFVFVTNVARSTNCSISGQR